MCVDDDVEAPPEVPDNNDARQPLLPIQIGDLKKKLIIIRNIYNNDDNSNSRCLLTY